LRLANRCGYLGVAPRFPRRDLPKFTPHGFLEGRSSDVDRQIPHRERAFDCRERASNQLAEAAGILDDRRVGEQPFQRILAVVERQPTYALAGCRAQHTAERTVEVSPADRFVPPAVAPS